MTSDQNDVKLTVKGSTWLVTQVQTEEQGTTRFKACVSIYRRITFSYPKSSSVVATSSAQQSNTREATVSFVPILARCLATSIMLYYAQTLPAFQVNLLSYLLIQLPETIVKQAAGQAAKTQVGTESCRAGQQWIGIHPWSFIIRNPCLDRFRRNKPKTPCICGTLLMVSLCAGGEATQVWQHSLFYLLPTTAGRDLQ